MRPYTREELLQKLQEVAQGIGRLPTQRELRSHGISEDPFYREFGSWSNALSAVDTSHTMTASVPPRGKELNNTEKLLEELRNNLTLVELKAVVQSSRSHNHTLERVPVNTKVEGSFKALATGDWHIGHNKFREDWFESMVERAISEKVDFCWCTGDSVEGMSNRPGHIYELEDLGFEAQFAHAKRLIESMPFQVRGITGNHCLWGMQKADQGIDFGKRLEESVPNFVYLGQHEATDIIGNIKVMLWHGNDGAAYSISYRTQKFVENLYGGQKPHILLAGHSHKSLFYETRNVHVLETGTLCEQTGFMRNKKLAAHTGYWILKVDYNRDGVVRVVPEWNAFY